MASGFEIAGIVLGALPLILEGLKGYSDGIVKLKCLSGCSKSQRKLIALKYRGMVMSLEYHHMQLKLDVMKLINYAKPDELVRELPEDYLHDFWHGPVGKAVEDYLRRVGGDSLLRLFKEQVEIFQSIVEHIAAWFDPDRAKTKRWKLAFHEEELKTQVKSLKGFGGCLRGLIDSDVELEKLVTENATSLAAKDIEKVTEQLRTARKNTHALFLALNSCWKSNCQHGNHKTFIRLTSSDHRRVPGRSKDTKFQVLLHWTHQSGQGAFWHESIVTTSLQPLPSMAPSPQTALPGATPGATNPPSVTFQVPASSSVEIRDLCQEIPSALQAPGQTALHLAVDNRKLFLTSKSSQQSTTTSQPATNQQQHPLLPSDPKLLTLNYFLKNSRRKLVSDQRLDLAIKLACSVLQFSETRWFGKGWFNDRILFFEDALSPFGVDTDHAFVAENFPCSDPMTCAPSEPTPTLLQLATILLEIYHHTTFDEWIAKKYAEPNPAGLDFRIRNWYLTQWEMALPPTADIATAVKICIRPRVLSIFDQDWEDPKYRSAFFQHVIVPLLEMKVVI